MSETNRVFRLAARPVGEPKPSDWTYAKEPIPTPGEREFLVRVSHISLDPAMRGWMNEGKSYIAPVEIGAVMRAGAAGEVDRLEPSGFPGRRQRDRQLRHADLRRFQRAGRADRRYP